MIFIDIRSAVLIVEDIVLYFIADRSQKAFKAEPGYPVFTDIQIKFQKGNSTDSGDQDVNKI